VELKQMARRTLMKQHKDFKRIRQSAEVGPPNFQSLLFY